MEDRPKTQQRKKFQNKHDITEALSAFKKSSVMSSTTDVQDTAEAPIHSLLPELLVEILSMLSVRDVIAFGSTCHTFHQLTLSRWTWRRLFRRQSRDWRLRNIRIVVKLLKIFTAPKKATETE